MLSPVTLKAPFPAFGGKSTVAADVWSRFGDVRNYIEPFAFSAAVLLKRPGGAGPIETINDLNSYVTNFWRAVQHDPEAVAVHADWPVIEDDLHARHRWLVTSDEAQNKLVRVREDPDYFDARIAGWWCWGACCWIGSGWCDETHHNQIGEQVILLRGGCGQGVTSKGDKRPHLSGSDGVNGLSHQMPELGGDGATGRGVHGQHATLRGPIAGSLHTKRPRIGDVVGVNGLSQQIPMIAKPGGGIGIHVDEQRFDDTHRPQLADAFSRGRGVNGSDHASTCDRRRAWLVDWMMRLADRLRPVRVCCGHWSRVCDSDTTLTRLGTTGVFLDPPYRKSLACGKKNRSAHIYANDKHQDVNGLCDEVQAWCLKWGSDPEIRIALCGYEGEYPAIEAAGWTVFAWKSNGGFGNRTAGGKENAARERIWYSPSCLKVKPNQGELFALMPA